MREKCFGLKNSQGKCSVLTGETIIKLSKTYDDFCCTMFCPFYKPNREDIRLGDRIIERSKK